MKTYTLRICWLFLAMLVFALPDAFAQKTKKVKYKNPTEKVVSFDSHPQGAKVIIDGKVIGATPVTATIPLTTITRQTTTLKEAVDSNIKYMEDANQIEVVFLLDGYAKATEYYKPRVQYGFPSKLYWSDGVFHMFSDEDTATAQAKPDVEVVTNANAYVTDGSIPAGEAQNAVNRDRPGQTALERTVIRWYFESAPQGARIFWRVISSAPDQVKNTNELWLGNTPFEETRSFNIQGLTYENSRDVQIEIKVKRNGYLDQTKRFNVRQAIDQQEISSFFDLIKAED